MRILLIEDDPKTALFIQKGLRQEGFARKRIRTIRGMGYVLE